MKRSVRRIITHSFYGVLIKTQRVNLSLLVLACLITPTITITELAKSFLCLPDSPNKKLNENTKYKHKEKRLARFLKNERVVVKKLFPKVLSLALKHLPRKDEIFTIIDQTQLPFGYQAIFAALAYKGRALPFAFILFRYEQIEKSQNIIEYEFFELVVSLLVAKRIKPVLIMDRGYCDVKIVKKLKELKVGFIIRAVSNVWIEVKDNNFKGLIGEFTQVGTFEDCLYHKRERELLNIAIARNEKGENIWVISNLNPSRIIELYKLRMQIEETFRDIKSLLGLKTLKLRKDEFIQMKLEKILLALMCTVIVSGFLEEECKKYSKVLVRDDKDYSFVRIVKEVVKRLWEALIIEPKNLKLGPILYPNLIP